MSPLFVRALTGCVSAAALCAAFPAFAANPETDAAEPPAEVKEVVVQTERKQTHATVEAATAAQIRQTINAVNVEDTVKYLPSLVVRKRHIGDTQAPLGTRTSGLGASARTLIYADGVLLSALIGNNNSTASPRWGMVAPEEVSSMTFLYGPFSAAYAGNSIGGVLNIKTRNPEKREGSIKLVGSRQAFDQYGTDDNFGAAQASAIYGDRMGNVWFRLSGNIVESNSQPLAYITAARPVAASAAGAAVTGPYPDVNRTGAPIAVFGAGGFEHQVQTNLKARIGVDLPFAAASYTISRFSNDTTSDVQTYATTATGPYYSGAANFGGYAYNLAASAFSNNVYARDDGHFAHALSLDSRGDGPWTWRLTASLYDYAKDAQRTPSTAVPGAYAGGAGTISRLDGTGWKTGDASAQRRFGAQALSFGAHFDEVKLSSTRNSTTDWISGADGALTLEARGKTTNRALWLQDSVSLNDAVTLTVGGRYDDWRASDGFNFSAAPALSVNQPTLSAGKFAPKATLEWAPTQTLFVTASYGEAYRFPTVTELYQAITTGPTLTVPNPTLRPEHARSGELALERRFEGGRLRASLFTETIDDALISQTAPLVAGSTTLFSYVQNIGETRVNGVELVAEKKNALVEGLDLSASATWTDPKVVKDPVFPVAEGKQLPGVPTWKATVVGTYRPTEKLALTLAGRYATRLYAQIDNLDVVTHTYQGFDGYLVADARVSYQINERWSAAAGVDNLFDRRYILFHPFTGRTVNAELAYRF